jgi:hypothetical protein
MLQTKFQEGGIQNFKKKQTKFQEGGIQGDCFTSYVNIT